jgi:hypothetical protein
VERNNSNYEKTYYCYAAAGGRLVLELVHDRRRKTGTHHDLDDINDGEKEHGSDHDAGNDRPFVRQLLESLRAI